MDTVVVLRAALSFACVMGLLWFVARRAAGGRKGAVRRSKAAALAVVARASLGGRTSVALIEVAGRQLVLGVAEHGVTLLAEVGADAGRTDDIRTALDTAELERLLALDAVDPAAVESLRGATATDSLDSLMAALEHDAGDVSRTATTTASSPAARMPAVPTPRSPLEGSILSATTWRRAVAAAQERTLRR